MKKCLMAALVLFCVAGWSADLPVPGELIGHQTMGVVHIAVKEIKYDQLVKTLSEKMGPAFDPKMLEEFKTVLDKFKEAGGGDITLVINADKKTDAASAGDGVVIAVGKAENADDAKLTEFLKTGTGDMKDKMDPACPKKIGDSLVWHSAKFPLPKPDEERAKAFGEAFTHLDKNSSVSIIFVPDEDAADLATANMKDAKPDDIAMVKALLGASSYCLFTDMGIAAEPNLKVLVVAADGDGAATINKAAGGLLDMAKKDAPPPLKTFLDTLKLVQAGANVQLSVDMNEIAKAAKDMMGAGAPPAK